MVRVFITDLEKHYNTGNGHTYSRTFSSAHSISQKPCSTMDSKEVEGYENREKTAFPGSGDLIREYAYSLRRQISVSTLRQADPSAFSMH